MQKGYFLVSLTRFSCWVRSVDTLCLSRDSNDRFLFSKYSEKSLLSHGARLAAFYAVSMMVYFTLAGLVVSAVFGVTGLQDFAAHPIFNISLAAILIFFALSLMGWFKIQTPMWAYNLTNKLEVKYGPNAVANTSGSESKGSGVIGDYVAVGVAAATSTTVFFTCTVAFVGLVLVAAADGEWFWPTLGMLAFSAAL